MFSDISYHVLFGLLCALLPDFLPDILLHLFSDLLLEIPHGKLFAIPSGILSNNPSGILLGISSGILPDINQSSILSGILFDTFSHCTWHFDLFIDFIERSFEVKFSTIWTDKKQRWEESEKRDKRKENQRRESQKKGDLGA